MTTKPQPKSRWKLSGSFRDPKRFHWETAWIFSESEALACFEKRKQDSRKITLIRMDRLPSGQWGSRRVVETYSEETAKTSPENRDALANESGETPRESAVDVPKGLR